jgi:hypothetical protein
MRICLVGCLLVACHSKQAPGVDATATTASTPSKAITPETSARAASLFDAAPDDWAAYWTAMKRGRAATVAKKYSDAIAAFDDAIRAVPRDARARAERGYAKFLSGNNDGAGADFDEAIDLVPASDKILAAQIYFNEGLVADKAGVTAAAAGYYRQSYELNPTAAAKSKMSTCPVVVTPFHVDVVADHAAAVARITGTSKPSIEDVDEHFIGVSDVDSEDGWAVVPVKSGIALFDTRVDITNSAKGRASDLDAEHKGSEWVVTGQAKVPGDATCVTDGPCTMTAPVEGGSHDVYWVDATTGAALWHASYAFSFVGQITLTVEAGGLHVLGAGCDVVTPRPPP